MAEQQIVQMSDITEQPIDFTQDQTQIVERDPKLLKQAPRTEQNTKLEETVNQFIETKTKTDEKMTEQLLKIESF